MDFLFYLENTQKHHESGGKILFGWVGNISFSKKQLLDVDFQTTKTLTIAAFVGWKTNLDSIVASDSKMRNCNKVLKSQDDLQHLLEDNFSLVKMSWAKMQVDMNRVSSKNCKFRQVNVGKKFPQHYISSHLKKWTTSTPQLWAFFFRNFSSLSTLRGKKNHLKCNLLHPNQKP